MVIPRCDGLLDLFKNFFDIFRRQTERRFVQKKKFRLGHESAEQWPPSAVRRRIEFRPTG